MEELEAYRASFGFGADEIIATTQYVEIADVDDDSFTIRPPAEEVLQSPYMDEKQRLAIKSQKNLGAANGVASASDPDETYRMPTPQNEHRGRPSMPNSSSYTDSEHGTSNRLLRPRTSRSCRRYPSGLSRALMQRSSIARERA
ncbi:hypothetical protein SAY86_028180 [Trapa natans]|uniref:Uncharacterized protein n=1 Tax=Trapa natans TaxID=22666 RepID=A0AAN7M1U6_TRANT|nr:hypothetical protein SAY86_028180 [Trapa natans]